MIDNETVYRYPLRGRLLRELMIAAALLTGLLWSAYTVLQLLWGRFPSSGSLLASIPGGGALLAALDNRSAPLVLTDAIAPFSLLAVALLAALLLRDVLPTIRTGPRGLLVEFAGDWLPLSWEHVGMINVTEGASQYVLLVETKANERYLTGWHRFYALLYRLSGRPGFLVTSRIDGFDNLVKTLLSETDRIARNQQQINPSALREDMTSPLFRLLLSPSTFFTTRVGTRAETIADPARAVSIRGSYPGRIGDAIAWSARLLLLGAILRYLLLVSTALTLIVPQLRLIPPFSLLELRANMQPLWMLIAAHITLALALLIYALLRWMLPSVEVDSAGLRVLVGRRQPVIPWSSIPAVKVTEIGPTSQVLLLQTTGPLSPMARLSSLLYDGSLTPGILITSAISNFEPLLQRIVHEVLRNAPDSRGSRIFQSKAYSPSLLMSINAERALERLTLADQLAEPADDAPPPPAPSWRMGVAPMLLLALLPALLLLIDRALAQTRALDGRVLVGALLLFGLALLEWPIVALGSGGLDDMSGGGEERDRDLALAVYPTSQMPRAGMMLLAALAAMLGVTILPGLLWIVAIIVAYVQARALWKSVYQWDATLLLAGGLLPVAYQALLLIGYLVVRG